MSTEQDQMRILILDAMERMTRTTFPDAQFLPTREYYRMRLEEWLRTLESAGFAIVDGPDALSAGLPICPRETPADNGVTS